MQTEYQPYLYLVFLIFIIRTEDHVFLLQRVGARERERERKRERERESERDEVIVT